MRKSIKTAPYFSSWYFEYIHTNGTKTRFKLILES